MKHIKKHPDLNNQDAAFISVIIVNWNGAAVLPRCLDSLRRQTYQNFELIIVDNGSTDRSWDGLEQTWPGLHLICLPENKGFAAANNIGVLKAGGEWIALLNIDAFPEPDWLEILVNATQQHPDFNFFSSTLIQAENPGFLDGTGDVYHISGLAWRRDYNQPITQLNMSVEEVFSPCAAAALYNRNAFLQVAGFDEDYFMYHEDVDLGFRMRLKKHKCLYVPDAVVYHLGSSSTSIKSDFSVYLGHRNLVWSFVQNMPGWLFWKYLPAHILANLVFLVYYSLHGKAATIWRAKWHAILGLPRAIRKRRTIQKDCKISLEEISGVMEHGWFYPYLREFRKRDQVQ
jgi:GT2 family glycosyltransferase